MKNLKPEIKWIQRYILNSKQIATHEWSTPMQLVVPISLSN